MDDPCLSRGLIADFPNSQCYKTTTTIENRYARITGGYTATHNYIYNNFDAYTLISPIEQCRINANSGFGDNLNGTYNIGQSIGSSPIGYINCSLWKTEYTCPIDHPIKLNDSTCEYRENF